MNRESSTQMSVLERQCSHLQEQLFNGDFMNSYYNEQGLCDFLLNGGAMKPNPGLETGWSHDFGRVLINYGNGPESEMSCGIPRTASCLPAMPEAPPHKGKALPAALSSVNGRDSFKKRKADKTQNLKQQVVAEEKSQEKRIKGSPAAEDDSWTAEQNSNSKSTTTTVTPNTDTNSKGTGAANSSKENSKVSEVPRTDYIHVRARRGQATDSHSLAERVRREKISERMKYLQDLVPGCNKITGKAGMLDEIINYVQSLQRQVEFLSMKLAAVSPRLDFDMDNYVAKEIFPGGTSSIPTIGVSSNPVDPGGHLQFNASRQGISVLSPRQCLDRYPCTGLEMGVVPPDVSLERTVSASVSAPDTLLDSSCFSQMQHLTWDAELQNVYSMECQQERSTPYILQPFTGFSEAGGHVKLEM